jgi:D-alanine-D-alanine ligase-like ATP-grasp enzyme
MDKNAKLYYQSAEALFLPAVLEPFIDGFVIELGKMRYYYYGAHSSLDYSMPRQIAADKYYSNQLLAQEGIPVPKSKLISRAEYEKEGLAKLIGGLSYPLVIKPRYGQKGFDVVCNISSMAQLEEYIKEKLPFIDTFVVEEFHANLKSYRVLLLNHKVIGVVLRLPPQVVGDGVQSVTALIEKTNAERKIISDTYGPIKIGVECSIRLQEAGIDLEAIPQKGQIILLGYATNATQGGTYIGLKTKVCRANKRLLARASRVIGLTVVGFDIECVDINLPIETTGGVIIEPNCNPSVRIHEEALSGLSTEVTKKIVRTLIWKHPVSYLCVLYHNKYTATFVKSVLALLGLGVAYVFLRVLFLSGGVT